MTWWSPLRVLQYAREAGFDNESAKRAATVALVASGGADHHAWDTPGVPGSAQNGLWAIPAGLVASVDGGDQFSPVESAATAFSLWHTCGRKFGWHPVVQADGGAMVWRTLDALDLDGLWTTTPKVMFSSLEHLRTMRYHSARIDKILSNYPVSH